jgi:hypothetical protein
MNTKTVLSFVMLLNLSSGLQALEGAERPKFLTARLGAIEGKIRTRGFELIEVTAEAEFGIFNDGLGFPPKRGFFRRLVWGAGLSERYRKVIHGKIFFESKDEGARYRFQLPGLDFSIQNLTGMAPPDFRYDLFLVGKTPAGRKVYGGFAIVPYGFHTSKDFLGVTGYDLSQRQRLEEEIADRFQNLEMTILPDSNEIIAVCALAVASQG